MSDTTTDNFDTLVNSTVPDKKYAHIVDDILRDKKHGWSLKYYEDSRTSWDPVVGRTVASIKTHELNIINNQAILDKQTKDLSKSRLPIDHKDYKPISKQEKKKMDLAYIVSTDEISFSNNSLKSLRPYLETILWSQYVESKSIRLMRHLRDKFMFDADQDFLERGVTWAFTYANKLRCLNDYTESNVDDVSEVDESCSAW
jgi:hypothetical protein